MLKQVAFFFLLFFLPVFLFSQQIDSVAIQKDTLSAADIYSNQLNVFLDSNKLLNYKAPPLAIVHSVAKRSNHQTIYFYIIVGVVLFLAFFKFSYAKYFNNLFRVFFNTSLRQSQLTDQLLQAKLPSLFFNIFFVISGGVYVYFLLRYFNWLVDKNYIIALSICIISVAIIYFVKYLTLKFTGWITGFTEPVNTYVFVVFLINKILGVFLVPFIIIIPFADSVIVKPAVLVSLFLIGLMLLLRFFRSYGLLQSKLRVSRFHFFLYLVGIEIIPLLVIYKGLMILLNKNL